MRVFGAIFLMAFQVGMTVASQADECRDVLLNPILDKQTYNNDSYSSTAVLSQLNESLDKNKNASGSVGFTIYGIPFNLGYSEASNIKRQLSKKYDFNAIQKDSTSILLLTGQASIIGAWRECMASRTRIGIRFEALDGHKGINTLMHIEYNATLKPGAPAPKTFELFEDVFINDDDAKVVSGRDCLKKGAIFSPGESCSVQLIMKSTWATLPILMTLKSDEKKFSISSYLPPRARVILESKPWNDSSGLHVFDNSAWTAWKCQDAQEGYMFIKEAISQTLTPGGYAMGENNCRGEADVQSEGSRVCIRAGIIGTPNAKDRWCTASFSGVQYKLSWDSPAP